MHVLFLLWLKTLKIACYFAITLFQISGGIFYDFIFILFYKNQ